MSSSSETETETAALRATIEHTLLSPFATDAEIEQLCQDALELGVRGVCVHPLHLARCAARLGPDGPLRVTVIGFPLGANHRSTKAFECDRALADGACELDVVADLGALKQRDRPRLLADLSAVVAAAAGHPVKVILETAAFGPEEWALGCAVAVEAGARFVKTSTGFGPGGASPEAVKFLRSQVPQGLGVKASGGIRSREAALAMLAAGADRIGTSSTRAIVQ
jgi:deoxyribose-phosphate aldolase